MDVVGRRCRRSVVVVVSRRRSVSTAKEAASFVVGCWGGAVDLCEERLQLLTPTHGLKGTTEATESELGLEKWKKYVGTIVFKTWVLSGVEHFAEGSTASAITL